MNMDLAERLRLIADYVEDLENSDLTVEELKIRMKLLSKIERAADIMRDDILDNDILGAEVYGIED